MRDIILSTKGNITSIPNKSDIALYKSFGQRLPNGKLNTTSSQYGLCLKTYNSDLLQNWINTEWRDGVNGISEASAVDVSDGPYRDWETDRKSTRLNSSHITRSRMPSSA